MLVQRQCHLQSLAVKDSERALLNMKVAHTEEISTEIVKHKHFSAFMRHQSLNIRVLFVSGYVNILSIQTNRMTK